MTARAPTILAMGGGGFTSPPGDPAPPSGTTGIAVNILRFMPEQSGQVTHRADWTLFGTKGKPLVTRSETLTAPSGKGASAEVDAMSGVLAKLAGRILRVRASCPS